MAFNWEIQKLCREDVEKRIVDRLPLMHLSLAKKEIAIRKLPYDREKIYEGITIHPGKEREGEGNCQVDDVGYGVAVTWVQGTGDGIREDIDSFDIFRSNIFGMFNNQKPSVPTVFVCTVDFGDFIIPKQYRDHYDSSSMLVRYWSEQERIA